MSDSTEIQTNRNTPEHKRTGASRGPMVTLAVVITLVAVFVAVAGILERKRTNAALEKYTNSTFAPAVAVVEPKLESSASEIDCPATSRPTRWRRSMPAPPDT